MSKAQIIEKAVASVRRAKACCPDIEFSPEDAARTELDFLCEVVEAAIEAGATTVNIPDTVGYATPLQYAKVISTLKERVPNIGQAVISTHCHDDQHHAEDDVATDARAVVERAIAGSRGRVRRHRVFGPLQRVEGRDGRPAHRLQYRVPTLRCDESAERADRVVVVSTEISVIMAPNRYSVERLSSEMRCR